MFRGRRARGPNLQHLRTAHGVQRRPRRRNFITQVIQGQAITIFGDGSQTRSFCYVADLIEGLLAAARIDAFDSPVNLGNPGELTMLELAEATMRVAQKRVDLVRKPLPKDDPRRRCPDITKARRLLGFEPKTPLEFGLRKTYEDFRARLAPLSQ